MPSITAAISAPGSEPMPPMTTTRNDGTSKLHPDTGGDLGDGSADHAGDAGDEGADAEDRGEPTGDVHAQETHHFSIAHAGAHYQAEAGELQQHEQCPI